MTTSYTLYYQQGEPHLHMTGCNHTRRQGFVSLTNAIENFDAETPEEALRLAGHDFAEALDYFDGRYELLDENGNPIPDGKGWYKVDIEGATKEGMSEIHVAPCAKTTSKPADGEEGPALLKAMFPIGGSK